MRLPRLKLLSDSLTSHEDEVAMILDLVASALAAQPALDETRLVNDLVDSGLKHPQAKASLTMLLSELEIARRADPGGH